MPTTRGWRAIASGSPHKSSSRLRTHWRVSLARIIQLVRWWGVKRVVGGVIGALGAALVVYFAVRVEPPPVEQSIPMPIPASSALIGASSGPSPSELLTVHVGGEVQHPGVYTLQGGSRVIDAVEAAGGVTSRAFPDAINLAAPLVDAVQVIVPRKGSPIVHRPEQAAAIAAPAGNALVNINSASASELDELPGVGPATAKAIVETRAKKGSFGSAEDLLDVPGIGQAKLAQIRSLITW